MLVSQITQKLLNRFSEKYDGKGAQGPRKKLLDSGDNPYHVAPCAVSGVVRIDPLRFLAGCRKATKPGLALSVVYLNMFYCIVVLGPLFVYC